MLESVLFPVGTILLGGALVVVALVAVFNSGIALFGGVAGCASLLRELRRHPASGRARAR